MNPWEKLFAQAKEKLIAAKALLDGENVDMAQIDQLRAEAADLKAKAEAMKAVHDELGSIGAPQRPANLPTGSDPDPAPSGDAVIKAVNVLRHGAIDEPTGLVMNEVFGADPRQLIYEQTQALKAYMRGRDPAPILKRQLWSIERVTDMLKAGLSVGEIKSTMVEGQDELGGYAVSPQVADQILGRLPGLTAVRGGGALVIQTSSSSIEWLKVSGSGSQYPSVMRGAWGNETKNPPDESNFTLGLQNIPVRVYTYKVPFSVSLLEDASNLVEVFSNLVRGTLAVDEDVAFLTGDGANKPYGILPGSTNARGLTEVVTGNADTLLWTGLRRLRRGIASPYRMLDQASWIGNSDTGGDIEAMQDGMGRDYIEALVAGEQFPKLRGIWRESEAMPDVAASAYPLVYANLSGYAIVERLGLSITRFHDSYTGINTVQFHIRRRIGGDVIEPWKFAAQKVAAS
ncbi:MAG: phage major capsid protein [Chloroflexi bacterium]|nr:phage major capsid protein [Chloroflexota bacterium]